MLKTLNTQRRLCKMFETLDVKELLKDFENGKFRRIYEKLSDVDSHQWFHQSNFWHLENIKLISRAQLGKCSESVDGMVYLLDQLKGLPRGLVQNCPDLIVTFNICYLKICICNHTVKGCICTDRNIQLIHEMMQRVLYFDGIITPKYVELLMQTHDKSDWDIRSIYAVLILYCFQLLMKKETDKTIVILEFLSEFSSNQKSKTLKIDDLKLAITLPLLDKPHKISDIQRYPYGIDEIVFLLTIGYFEREDFEKCLDVIENNIECVCTPSLQFIKGMVYFKQGKFEDCMGIMQHLTFMEDEIPISSAEMKNIIGLCFSRQKKYHSAIQMFKEALQTDFEFHLSLYNLSLQYREMGLVDAELESLKLLVMALQKKSSPVQKTKARLDIEEILLHQFVVHDRVTLQQAMYAQAKRNLECARYETASIKYLTLVTSLTENGYPKFEDGSSFNLPHMRKILQETAYALLQAKQYEKAISICEQLISNFTPTTNQMLGQQLGKNEETCLFEMKQSDLGSGDGLSNQSLLQQRKRQRSQDSLFNNVTGQELSPCGEVNTCNDMLDHDILAEEYKIKALVGIGKEDSALKSLTSLILTLESDYCSHSSCDAETTNDKPPVKKKAKMDTGSETVDQSSHIDCQIKDSLAKCYHKKAIILISKDQRFDALHCSSLALQLKPNDTIFTFHHTEILKQIGRNYEAAILWLQFQGFATKIDTFELSMILKRKQEDLSAVSEEITDGISEKDHISQDIFAYTQIQQKILKTRSNLV